MGVLSESLVQAFHLIIARDDNLMEIIGLSLQVTLSSTIIASIISLPLAVWLAGRPFWGQKFLIIVMNSMMGFPPVVMGLLVYLLLSRNGPLGIWGLLYTPTAMIIAQTLLIIPLITATSCQHLQNLHEDYQEFMLSMGLNYAKRLRLLLYEGRYSLLVAILNGFGRATAEVGAVMLVGGNVKHFTRVMTTTIALETSKGDYPLAMGLGLILLSLALLVNLMMTKMGQIGKPNPLRLSY